MSSNHAAMMGKRFNPDLPVVVTFSNGAPALFLEALESVGPNLWLAEGVKDCRFNARGVAVINEHGEIQRPWKAMACNVVQPPKPKPDTPPERPQQRDEPPCWW